MADREELLRAARERRETAARIRRLAQGLSLNADHERLKQQATEIEEEARQLERQVAEGDPRHGHPFLAACQCKLKKCNNSNSSKPKGSLGRNRLRKSHLADLQWLPAVEH